MKVKSNATETLKELRLKIGLSGAEMSRRMGLGTVQHYWNIENGRNRLTLEYAFDASKALGVSKDFFICESVKQNV